MTPTPRSLSTCAWLVALASVGTASCLCPPCPGKVAVAGPAAPGTNAAAPAPTGSRLVIWDGDESGTGGQSWGDSCDQQGKCKIKVGVEPGVGLNGSNAIKFHGEGADWIGTGWNLFGWYPPNAGVDISPYSHLTFQIRVDAKSPQDAPEPGAVTVSLGCSANKFGTADAPIEKYAKGFTDGKWHKVVIPISALTKGQGVKFDLQSFWEFRISTWSGSPRNFDIYIDDIAAEKK